MPGIAWGAGGGRVMGTGGLVGVAELGLVGVRLVGGGWRVEGGRLGNGGQ